MHIASQPVQVGTHLRQRCVWCGEELIDQDLALVAVPVGQDHKYPTWPTGGLIGKDVGMTYVVDHVDGEDLPKTSCVAPDNVAEVTGG